MSEELINSELEKNLIDIARKYELSLLVLFGSRVNGNYTKYSDWDFAFKKSKDFSTRNYQELYQEFNKIFERFDLVDLDKEEDILLKRNIAENSKLIYEDREGVYDLFVVNSVYEYIDYLPFFKIEEEIINSRLERL